MNTVRSHGGPVWESGICNGEYYYMGCTGMQYQDTITSVIISYGIEEIGEATFMGTVALTAISIPDSVTRIDHDAFYKCKNLTSITIPNSVTDLEDVFCGCSSLTNITIPDSVTSIENAFYACTALTTVNYTGTEEQWKNITIGTNNDPLTSATIVYNYKE